MTDQNAPVPKHIVTAKEHLAGIAASRAWIQDLSAQHLLHGQAPIKDTPYPGPPAPEQ